MKKVDLRKKKDQMEKTAHIKKVAPKKNNKTMASTATPCTIIGT